jgi:hypothetical protein
METFEINFVCGDKMFTLVDIEEPKMGMTISHASISYRVIGIKKVSDFTTPILENHCYICLLEIVEFDMTGITQIKFIQGNSYDDMEKNLNKFLFENRHRYEILDITHAVSYVAVKYKKRNERDIKVSKDMERTYKDN